jgi:hypothetical protein
MRFTPAMGRVAMAMKSLLCSRSMIRLTGRAVLALGLGLGSSPSWAAFDNSSTGWKNSGLNLNSVCQIALWANGCKIAEAWGSSDYDSRRGRMFFTGGGHNDGRGNEMLAFNLGTGSAVTDTQTVTRIRNGTSFTALSTCEQNGSWRSHHNWSSMAFYRGVDANNVDTAANDRYVFSVAGTADDGDIGGNCLISYNPNTDTYLATTLHAELAANRNNGFYGGGFVHDKRQHVIIAVGQQAIYYYNPRTNVWTKPTQTDYNDDFADTAVMGSTIDPVRRRYYVIGRGKIWYWNISGTGTIVRVTPTVPGSCSTFASPMDDGPASYEYYPYRDLIVSWRGGNTIHMYNTVSNVCTSTSFTGGPTLPSNIHQVAGRFRFVPKDNLFLTCNNTVTSGSGANAQCWALRMDLQSSDTDFMTRARAPGVTTWQGFDNAADLTNGLHYFTGSAGTSGRTIDTAIKTSGTGSFALIIPAGNSSDTPSGEWRNCLIEVEGGTCSPHTNAPGFGQNTTFYYQYRVRITPTMVTNLRDFWFHLEPPNNNSRTGWKHANLHNVDQGSCGPVELTGTISIDDTSNTGIWYTNCSAPQMGTTANGVYNVFGPYEQQGNNTATTATLGFWCNNHNVIGTGNGTGCFRWQWQNEWLTFTGRVTLGTFGSANSSFALTVAREGATVAWPINNVTGFTFNANAPAIQRTFNMISFTNFMTGNNVAAPFSATMWYDEFIVSTEPIDLPGQVSASVPTPQPPDAPTNVRLF